MTIEVSVVVRAAGRGHLAVKCAQGVNGICRFPIWTQPAGNITWQWDGNVEQPTITPSIACIACGKHFTVTKGVAQ